MPMCLCTCVMGRVLLKTWNVHVNVCYVYNECTVYLSCKYNILYIHTYIHVYSTYVICMYAFICVLYVQYMHI